MSFPDYPDYLITNDPRSPFYDDSFDNLTAEDELPDLDEIPRNWKTEAVYKRYEKIMALRRWNRV